MQPLRHVASPRAIQTPTTGSVNGMLKYAWSWCHGFSRPLGGFTIAMSWNRRTRPPLPLPLPLPLPTRASTTRTSPRLAAVASSAG